MLRLHVVFIVVCSSQISICSVFCSLAHGKFMISFSCHNCSMLPLSAVTFCAACQSELQPFHRSAAQKTEGFLEFLGGGGYHIDCLTAGGK